MNDKVDSASDERVVNNVMRHEYRKLNEDEKRMMQLVKDKGLEFHNLLTDVAVVTKTTGSRELSLAKTKIEEAVMWAVKHLTA